MDDEVDLDGRGRRRGRIGRRRSNWTTIDELDEDDELDDDDRQTIWTTTKMTGLR